METRITFYKDQGQFLKDHWYSGRWYSGRWHSRRMGGPATWLGRIILCDEVIRAVFGNKLPQRGKFILVISLNPKLNYCHVQITKQPVQITDQPNFNYWTWIFLGEEGKTLQEHLGRASDCFVHSERVTSEMLKKITGKENLPETVDLWLRVKSCS